ncbi:MAG: hypothetical protein EPO26_12535 [Chloroflexota bacterium]|nr:MAG: hypothetical protein EPO26_12535 [Chloroflexota bacterium]
MKSISIMWAQGVTDTEARTAVATIRDIVKTVYDACFAEGVLLGPTQIRPFGNWVIPTISTGNPYGSAAWYMETAFDAGRGQIVAPRFLELVRREPWQAANAHFDLAILDRDLADEPEKWFGLGHEPFVLGSVLPGTATVVSVFRLRDIADLRVRMTVLRRLIVHNFGHVLEAPGADRTEEVAASSGERHCVNRCALRDVTTFDNLIEFAQEERDASVSYCARCRRDIMRATLMQRFSRN